MKDNFFNAICLPHSNAVEITAHDCIMDWLLHHASISIRSEDGEQVTKKIRANSLYWYRHDTRQQSATIPYIFNRRPKSSFVAAFIEVLDNNGEAVFTKRTTLRPTSLHIEGFRESGKAYGWLTCHRNQKIATIRPGGDSTNHQSLSLVGQARRHDVEATLRTRLELANLTAYCYDETLIASERPGQGERLITSKSYKLLEGREDRFPDYQINDNAASSRSDQAPTLDSNAKEFSPEDLAATPRPVSIIIPIYKGLQETIQCIESLHKHPHILSETILGIDYSDDQDKILTAIQELPYQKKLRIIAHKTNQGFVENVNKCFREASPSSDVLLLNSDVYCPRNDWVRRLQITAYSDSAIGTVTPLGSAATLYSFPTNNINNSTILGLDTTTIDSLLKAINPRISWVTIPTCHGFCVYIKRTALGGAKDLFLPTWGQGYGEENCLSMRLAQQGWIHACATNVFMYHHESISFSVDKREKLKARNLKTLTNLYPDYSSLISEFSRRTPLSKARKIGVLALLHHLFTSARPNTKDIDGFAGTFSKLFAESDMDSKDLFSRKDYSNSPALASQSTTFWISHARGGGTHKAMCDQMQKHFNKKQELPILIQSLLESKIALKIHDPSGVVCHIIEVENADREFFEKLEAIMAPSKIFIHSLVDADYHLIEWLENSSSPTHATVHDYHWICPLIHLVDYRGVYCNAKTGFCCEVCFAQSNDVCMSVTNQVTRFGGSVSSYRNKFLEILAKSDEIQCPSESTSDIINRSLRKYGLSFNKIVTRPHEAKAIWGSSLTEPKSEATELAIATSQAPSKLHHTNKTIKIACIGAISMIKGFSLLERFCNYVNQRDLDVIIDIIGFTCDNSRVLAAGGSHVKIRGRYDDKDLDNILKGGHFSAALFLSICPETYSFTFTAAVKAGICPVFLPRGAILERAQDLNIGIALPEWPTPEVIYHSCIQASRLSLAPSH